MVTIKKCDLLKSDAKFLCHQVNCRGRMGAGVAQAIAEKYPNVRYSYYELCKCFLPDQLLGKYQAVLVTGGRFVVNIFGQLDYVTNFGKNQKFVYTNYAALKKAFQDVRALFGDGGKIAFPYKFGCGLAGGDCGTVEGLIVDCLGDFDVELCMF